MENKKQVSIYSTPTCVYCKAAKEFFNINNISYTEHDVAADAKRRQEMIERSGQMGVPVIEVGEDIVVGFDKKLLSELLGVK